MEEKALLLFLALAMCMSLGDCGSANNESELHPKAIVGTWEGQVRDYDMVFLSNGIFDGGRRMAF